MPVPDDDAPTKPTDWIGAAEIRPGHKAGYRAPENPTTFFVFRSSADATLFAVNALLSPLQNCSRLVLGYCAVSRDRLYHSRYGPAPAAARRGRGMTCALP